MIIQEDKNEFESSLTESATFKIAATPKMFQMLSASVYSDRTAAVIRELACNAYDAHKAIGSEKKFQIFLPSRQEPIFKIRDFGPGLAESQMTMYTTYGESTKTSSNEFVGAFGIGAKSPFAYTKTFNVTSWNQGRKLIYIMFEDDYGCPQMTKVYDSPDNEESGLEISFSVELSDISNFHSKCNEQLAFMQGLVEFPSWPQFEENFNSNVIEWVDVNSDIKISKGSRIRFQNYASDYANFSVVQSFVKYQLSWASIREFLPEGFNSNLVFEGTISVANGTFSPHPSRETLTFSTYTKQNMRNVLKEVIHFLFEKPLEDLLSSVNTNAELLIKLRDSDLSWDLLSNLDVIEKWTDPSGKDFKSFNKSLSQSLDSVYARFYNGALSFTSKWSEKIRNMLFTKRSGIIYSDNYENATSLNPHRNNINYYLTENNLKEAYIVPKTILAPFFQDSDYDLFGIHLKDLPLAPPKVRAPRAKVNKDNPTVWSSASIMVSNFSQKSCYFKSNFDTSVLSGQGQIFYYLDRKFSKMKIFGEDRNFENLGSWMASLYRVSLKTSFEDTYLVYLLNPEQKAKLSKNNTLINFEEVIKDFLNESVESVLKYFSDGYNFAVNVDNISWAKLAKSKLKRFSKETGLFKELHENGPVDSGSLGGAIRALIIFCQQLGFRCDEIKGLNDNFEKASRLKEAYSDLAYHFVVLRSLDILCSAETRRKLRRDIVRYLVLNKDNLLEYFRNNS